MKKVTMLCLSAWVCSPSTALAQHPTELLRQRVLSELLLEGISLERLGQDIMLFHKGRGLWLQLQDTRGEMLAQRYVPDLPLDLEAAVAQLVMQVVAMMQKSAVGQPAPSSSPRIFSPASPKLGSPSVDAQALESYRQRFIGLDEAVLLNREGIVVSDALPYLGKYKKPLRGADFYKAVGRPDLALIYLRNRRAIVGLNISAAFLYIGGLAAGLTYSFVVGKDGCSDCNPPRENNELEATLIGTGGIFGGASLLGTILIIVGSYLPHHPVTPPQARKLIDDHNRKLRQQLDLPFDPDEPSRPNGPRLPSFGVAPFVGPQGGGLGVTGRF